MKLRSFYDFLIEVWLIIKLDFYLDSQWIPDIDGDMVNLNKFEYYLCII